MKKSLTLVLCAVPFIASCNIFSASSASSATPNNGGASAATTKKTTCSAISPDPLTYNLRSASATITDSGRSHQQMDICYYPHSGSCLKQAGYNYVQMDISFEAKEVDDGYQYVFIYNTKSCQGDAEKILGDIIPSLKDGENDGLLFSKQFEIGGKGKKTSWEKWSFTAITYVEYIKDNIYIRYGASGDWSDTWTNRNVSITVTPLVRKP